jgi:hypothetical protein
VQGRDLAQAVADGAGRGDAEPVQDPQGARGTGDDARLRGRGVGQVAALGQRVGLVEGLDLFEAAADRSAVGPPPGALAGEEQADTGAGAAAAMSSTSGFSWPVLRRTSGSNAVALAGRGYLSPRSVCDRRHRRFNLHRRVTEY